MLGQTDRQKDGRRDRRTLYHFIDPAAHTMRAMPINCEKVKTCLEVVPEAERKVTAAFVDRVVARDGRTLLQHTAAVLSQAVSTVY